MKYKKIKHTSQEPHTNSAQKISSGNKKNARKRKISSIQAIQEKIAVTGEVKARELRILRSRLSDRQEQIESLERTNKKLRSQLQAAMDDLNEYKMLWENRKIRKESTGRNNIYTGNTAKEIWEEYVYTGKTIRAVADAHSYMDGNGKETKMSTKTCTELIHQYDDQFCAELISLKRFIDLNTKKGRAENKQLHRIVKRKQKTNPEYVDKISKFML